MPPFFDQAQIANALRNEALPALDRLAQNEALRDRSLKRFDREEPPDYCSSTDEEDEEEMYNPALGPVDSAVYDELNRILEEPLNDVELDRAASTLKRYAYTPGDRYDEEAKIEKRRIERWAARYGGNDQTRQYLYQYGPARKLRAGIERVNIIARHNIKRRWQKLGVWNPAWGIPDRADSPQPNDNRYNWKWRWEERLHDDDITVQWHPFVKKTSPDELHPSAHALHLRMGLRRSEHPPVPPHPHLEEDAQASEADAFVTSRPWFMFQLENGEERERCVRVPIKMRRLRYQTSIQERWKERGVWQEEWHDKNTGDTLIGWKWRHESPSPEPEDLSGLDDLATFELTPSEADALEAVPPPSPPTPEAEYYHSGPPLIIGRLPAVVSKPTATETMVEESRPPPRSRRSRQQPATEPLRRSSRISALSSKTAKAAEAPKASSTAKTSKTPKTATSAKATKKSNRSAPPRASKPPARRGRRSKKTTTR